MLTGTLIEATSLLASAGFVLAGLGASAVIARAVRPILAAARADAAQLASLSEDRAFVAMMIDGPAFVARPAPRAEIAAQGGAAVVRFSPERGHRRQRGPAPLRAAA